MLRKPGEQDNPVVETVSMNDLRYNMYGGARYPAPAVVGGLGGAIGGAMDRSAAQIVRGVAAASTGARSRGRSLGSAPIARQIEVYRGTTSDQVKVGGNGR